MSGLQLRRCLAAAVAFIAVGSGGVHTAAFAAEYSAFKPMPSGTVLVTRPSISWRVFPTHGSRILRVTVALNDKDIPATFDPAKSIITTDLDKPLTPGTYNVKCSLYFDDTCVMGKNWAFSVNPAASDALPEPTADQRACMDAVNVQRKRLSLAPLQLDAHLCAAAQAHSSYMQSNMCFGHLEQVTLSGFTGSEPGDRAAAFGYNNASYEDLESGVPNPADYIRDLFDAPYHRAPFLQPGNGDFGGATVGDMTTLEFGVSNAYDDVVYPADGQKDVPVDWEDAETPDPLRMYDDMPDLVGYVVTLYHFSMNEERIRVSSASLTTTDGAIVPTLLNTPANDNFLTNGMMLIPKLPLKPHTTYIAMVSVSTDSGQDISRKWSFTTGDVSRSQFGQRPGR